MSKVLITESYLENIADAIRAKNGSQNTYTPGEMSEAIDNLVVTTPTAEEKDVNFYDYDGTRVYSYTKTEFLALESMPQNPAHSGLTAQGWNWTLQDAKNYVTNYGILDVGQMYVTDDNKTRIYVELSDERKSPYLGLAIDGTATIDWGDESSDTISGTNIGEIIYTQHNYASGGKYVIKIQSQDDYVFKPSGRNGTSAILQAESSSSGNSYLVHVYDSTIRKIELSNKVSLESLDYCSNLETITIPEEITNIGGFASCKNLKAIIIPKNVTNINANAFNNSSLKRIVMSGGITSIGQNAFASTSTDKVIVPPNVTVIPAYMCGSDANSTREIFIIPYGVTQIGNSGISGYSITKIIVPNTVTSFGTNCFNVLGGVKYYDFSTFTNVPGIWQNIFPGISSDCKIVVPDDLYEDWIAAYTWSTYASYIIKKTDWDALQTQVGE